MIPPKPKMPTIKFWYETIFIHMLKRNIEMKFVFDSGFFCDKKIILNNMLITLMNISAPRIKHN